MSAEPKQKQNGNAVKKKVSPYPFAGEMTHGAVKVLLSIERVSPKGLIAHVVSGICHVGTHYQCQFWLPQGRDPVLVEGKVFKTFDRSTDPKDFKKIERLTEVLFLKLSEKDQKAILTFMRVVGQKD